MKITPEELEAQYQYEQECMAAEGGAAINETLHKKLPDKILEIEKTKTEIYQKGIFGGLRKIN